MKLKLLRWQIGVWGHPAVPTQEKCQLFSTCSWNMEYSTQEEKSMHPAILLAAKITCLKSTCKCVFFCRLHVLETLSFFLLFFTSSINIYLIVIPAEHWGMGFFWYTGSTKLSHSSLDPQPRLHPQLWRTSRTCHCLLGQGFLFPLRFYYRLEILWELNPLLVYRIDNGRASLPHHCLPPMWLSPDLATIHAWTE